MNRFVAGLCGLLAGFCFVVGLSPGDTGAALKDQVGHDIFILANPRNHASGGTGFSVRAPSGHVYTLTNGHVCDIGHNGYLDADVGGGRYIPIRILEWSATTDLCILEAVPGARHPLQVDTEIQFLDRLYVIGHPHLNPLTLSEGFVVGRSVVDILSEHEPCTGPTYSMERFEGIFGEMQGCIRHLDSIQTSAIIYPGSSGSPVLTERGKVVGVMFAGDQRTHYGTMVPVEYVREFLSKY